MAFICTKPQSTHTLNTVSSLGLPTSESTEQKYGQKWPEVENGSSSGIKVTKKCSQICSDQNELKETVLSPPCGSAVKLLAAGVVGAESEFKKHLDKVENVTEGYPRRTSYH